MTRRAGELLLEIRAEEMPPRLVPEVASRLGTRLFEVLMGAGLAPREIQSGYTRRRLVYHCLDLPQAERPRSRQEIGPPAAEAWDADGEPTDALIAFSRRLAVATEDVTEVHTERGRYAGIEQELPGRATRDVLATALPSILADVPFEQSMLWGAGQGPWLRPILSILALLDGEPIPFAFCGIEAGASTAGHPILSPERFVVANAADYFDKLAARGIVVRAEARQAILVEALKARVAEHDGADLDEAVDNVAEVVARMALDCEIPGLVQGDLDPAHMKLPEEIIVATLSERPGAIVLRDRSGGLAPRFLAVTDRPDDPSGRVRAGYERAVYGRLADAAFLRATDRQRPLAAHAAIRLAELDCPHGGSWADHDRRVGVLAAALLEELGRSELGPAAEMAASLLHADRVTALVAELGLPPGMVGGLYARDDGHDESVWQAIYDHNAPRGHDDPLPRGEVGRVIALADRLLRLGAARGGARQPPIAADRKLRRLADGAVRLLIESRFGLDVDLVVGRAVRLLGSTVTLEHDTLTTAVADLLRARAYRLLGRHGFAFEEVDAASAVAGGSLVDLLGRVEALRRRQGDPILAALARTARRIERVVAGTDATALPESPIEPAEQVLADTLSQVRRALDTAIAAEQWDDALDALVPLIGAVDRFFEEVLVMAEDPRQRAERLALLHATRRLLRRVGNLGKLDAGGGSAPRVRVADVQSNPEDGVEGAAERESRGAEMGGAS